MGVQNLANEIYLFCLRSHGHLGLIIIILPYKLHPIFYAKITHNLKYVSVRMDLDVQ